MIILCSFGHNNLFKDVADGKLKGDAISKKILAFACTCPIERS
jgi:hypothetical protein